MPVVDGAIDYDAGSQAPNDKNLWRQKSFRLQLRNVYVKAVPDRGWSEI